jgi:energy-coupling factor transport system ATP-binding protein
LAAGLLRPGGGSVSADGAAPGIVRGADGRLSCAVGIAFQRPENQLFAASVAEDVAFGPRNLGADRDEAARSVERALEAVRLSPREFGGRSPFTLSGGEARRVALAGVLAMSPSYLLLDEPTAGLDAPGRAAVVEVIRRARDESGVVVVTHDAEEFLADADGVVVLSDGTVAFSGDVGELLDDAERLDADGLWTPPEVVRVQILAQRAGRLAGPGVLDPEAAAARLVEAVGRA